MGESMKLYVAAPWVRKADAIEQSQAFIEAGHEVISRWFHHEGPAGDPTGALMDPDEIRRQVAEDIEDVRRCDVLVVLNLQKSEGKAVETGLAIAAGKPIISVGPRSNVFQILATEVNSVEEAIDVLSKR